MKTNFILFLMINLFIATSCCDIGPKEKNYIISQDEEEKEEPLSFVKEK